MPGSWAGSRMRRSSMGRMPAPLSGWRCRLSSKWRPQTAGTLLFGCAAARIRCKLKDHQPIFVDAPGVCAIGPIRQVPRGKARSLLQPVAVEIDNVAAHAGVIGEHFPGKGLDLLSDSKEAAERYDGIGNLAGVFVDHQVMHFAEALTFRIVDRCAFHLVGGNEPVGLVGCKAAGVDDRCVIHLVISCVSRMEDNDAPTELASH